MSFSNWLNNKVKKNKGLYLQLKAGYMVPPFFMEKWNEQ